MPRIPSRPLFLTNVKNPRMTFKKALPFLPYLAVVLAIIGYFAFFGQSKTALPSGTNRDVETASSPSAENRTGPSPEEIRASNLAKYTASIDAADIDACSEISEDDELHDKCVDNVYAALAAKNKDSDYCEKIADPSTKSKCADSFAYDEAVEKGDSALCRKLSEPELAKACVRTVTFAKIESGTGSAAVVDECVKLDSEADREYCQKRVANSASVDLAKEALLKKDRSICLRITDKVLSNSCSDAVILETVATNGDASSCALVVDVAKKTKCETVA